MFKTKNVIVNEIGYSKENILKLIPQEDIFKRYFGEFTTGCAYNSPLRKGDSNPSFNIYYSDGILLYKDFAHSTGDCFKFVQELYGLSYKEAINKILTDFEIDKTKVVIPNRSFTNKTKVKESICLQIEKREFSEKDINYWKQFYISRNTLDYYKVYSVSKIFRNKYLFLSINKDVLCFAYLVNNNFKIYFPLNEKYKWYSNIRFYSIKDIQGFEQLDLYENKPKKELLIITKSLKDVMVFYELGIDSIAISSESVTLSKEYIDYLLEYYNNIIINTDNDEQGNKIIQSYKDTYKDYINITYFQIPTTAGTKDPAEFVKKYDLQTLKNLIINGRNRI